MCIVYVCLCSLHTHIYKSDHSSSAYKNSMWSGLCQPSPLISVYLFTVLQLQWLPFWSSDGLNSFLPACTFVLGIPSVDSFHVAFSIPSLSNLLYCHLLRIWLLFPYQCPTGHPFSLNHVTVFITVIAQWYCTYALFKLLFYCQLPHNESHTPMGRTRFYIHC